MFLCGCNPFSRNRANVQAQPVHTPPLPQEHIELAPPTKVTVPPATVDPTTVEPPQDTVAIPISVPPEHTNLASASSHAQTTVSSPTNAIPQSSLYPPPKLDVPIPNADSKEHIDSKEMENIRKKCREFRVLITGKANSGKTTIIQKMCDSNKDPVVRDEMGNIIPASQLEGPNAMRGLHDIRFEIRHESNPNFVFHDSRGFEAGSVAEFEYVKNFIKEKLEKDQLRLQLHVIWFCVPLDGTRVASEAELSFFKERIGDVPVIVVFTKWDGQVIRAFNKLENDGKGIAQAKKEAPQLARTILEENFIPVFKNTAHPPAGYAVLGHLNKPETKCSDLVEKTEAALNNSVLKKLFVSVQTHNLQLCIKNGIEEAVSNFIFSSSSGTGLDPAEVIRVVVSWFPHAYHGSHDYSYFDLLLDLLDPEDFVDNADFVEIVNTFQPVLASTQQAFSSLPLLHLTNAATAAIVATRSFDLKQRGGTVKGAFKASIEEYLASSQCDAVKTAITSDFGQYTESLASGPPKKTLKTISEELEQVCLNNLLH